MACSRQLLRPSHGNAFRPTGAFVGPSYRLELRRLWSLLVGSDHYHVTVEHLYQVVHECSKVFLALVQDLAHFRVGLHCFVIRIPSLGKKGNVFNESGGVPGKLVYRFRVCRHACWRRWLGFGKNPLRTDLLRPVIEIDPLAFHF